MRIRRGHNIETPSVISAAADATRFALHIGSNRNGDAARSADSALCSVSRYKTNWLEKLRAAKGFPVEPAIQIHEFVSSLSERANGSYHEKPICIGSPSVAEGHRQHAASDYSNQSKQVVDRQQVMESRCKDWPHDNCIKEEQLSNNSLNGTNTCVQAISFDNISTRHDLSFTETRSKPENSAQDGSRMTNYLQLNDLEQEVMVKKESVSGSDTGFTEGARRLEREATEPADFGPENAFYEYIFGISSSYSAGRVSSGQSDLSKKHKRKQFKPRICLKHSETPENDIAGSTDDVTETAKPNATESAGENVSTKLCNLSQDRSLHVLSSVLGIDTACQTGADETAEMVVATMRHCSGHLEQDLEGSACRAEEKQCDFKSLELQESHDAVRRSCIFPSPINGIMESGHYGKMNPNELVAQRFSLKGRRTSRGGKLGNVANQSAIAVKNRTTSGISAEEDDEQSLRGNIAEKESGSNQIGLASKLTMDQLDFRTVGTAPSEKSDMLCQARASWMRFPVDHPARQSEETLVFSVYQVFSHAGKSGLTAREAVSKILEGGLPGLHEGGVIPRIEVGKILRTSPYFMELEESKYVLCSAVVGADEHNFVPKNYAVNKDEDEHAPEGSLEACKGTKQKGSSQIAAFAGARRARTGTTRRKTAQDELSPDLVTGKEASIKDRPTFVMPQKKRLKSVKQDSSRLGNRCNRSDGKGWHCPLYAQVGYLLCDHHLEKLRLKSASRSRNTQ